MNLESTPENCSIVGKILLEFCPDLKSFSNSSTYESIRVPDGYTGLPSKEVFDARLVEYINNIPWDKLRTERNNLISETDYLILPDYTISSEEKKQEWLNYRQTLRDLPSNTTDPENPVWPTKPSN